jgi:hypothetical protein
VIGRKSKCLDLDKPDGYVIRESEDSESGDSESEDADCLRHVRIMRSERSYFGGQIK